MRKSSLTFSVLQLPNFRLLLGTRMFALMAMQAQAVVVGWQIYSLTHDPMLLGLTGLAEAVPAISCALFAGHIVDGQSRVDRVYLMCLGALALNTAMLFLVGGGLLDLSSHGFLVLIYSGIFISGIARSFIMPASFSLLAEIVPRKDISAASGWLSSGFQASIIISPAVAGLVYGGYGAFAAWLMPLLLICGAFFMMSLIRVAPRSRPVEKREPTLISIKQGWSFIMKTPALLAAMAVDMLAVLFGGAVALLPAFAEEILHIGPEGLGALRTAPAVGALVTALYFSVRPMATIPMSRLLWVVTGFGICMLGFGLSHVFWLSLLFLCLSGAFDSVSVVIRSALMQLLTPEPMRGRVASVNSMFIISSNELGAFESGALAKLLGLVPSVVIGGAGSLIVAGATALFSPNLRKIVIRADEKA